MVSLIEKKTLIIVICFGILKKIEMKLKIKSEDWNHKCGDGCCYTYGNSVHINGEYVTSGDYHDIDTILKDVLEHLGYEVEFEEVDYA
jgi:hypothetical protein